VNAWVVAVSWLVLYLAAILFVPYKRLNRGWITRYGLAKIVPIKWLWRPGEHWGRYMFWWGLNIVLDYTVISGKKNYDLQEAIFWGAYVVFLLDDYINGDDDPKERWDKAKNKIKWLWLPQHDPHPIKEVV
jgi:hypothetical protein